MMMMMMRMMIRMMIMMRMMRMSIRKVPGAFRSEVQGRSVGPSSNGDPPLISNAIVMMMVMLMMVMMMMSMMRVIVMMMTKMMTLVEPLLGFGLLSQMPLWLHCCCIFHVCALYFFGFTLSFYCIVLYLYLNM